MKENVFTSEEYIYNLIKDKIIKRELFPKNKIIELQLAEETGISRTPIRKALQKLSYEGLIELIPNRGAFVASPTLKEIISVYECKKILEAAAIEKACSYITDKELELLEEILIKGIQTHSNKDLQSFLLMNKEFHMTIARISRNKCYEKFITELIDKSNVYLIFYDTFTTIPTEESVSIKQHYKILDALRSRNVDACIEASINHNQITLERLNLDNVKQCNE